MANAAPAGPTRTLRNFSGTRPRLANSSRTRGMTPGSDLAWREKQVAEETPRSAATETDDISVILGIEMANHDGPSPCGARVANSPDAGAMRRSSHPPDVRPDLPRVKQAPS